LSRSRDQNSVTDDRAVRNSVTQSRIRSYMSELRQRRLPMAKFRRVDPPSQTGDSLERLATGVFSFALAVPRPIVQTTVPGRLAWEPWRDGSSFPPLFSW
jgi:hypothetical protein